MQTTPCDLNPKIPSSPGLDSVNNRIFKSLNTATTTGSLLPPDSSLTGQFSNLSTTDDSKFIFKNKPQTTTSSLKQHELAKFAAISDTWWDSEGPFKPLHVMNPTRIAFIRSTLCRHFSKDPNCARPFEGLKIVDVGCGGGILSEPLARMGAAVTGVDAVEKNINVARLHADLDPETSTIEYCCTTAEKLVEEQRKFDAVIALEAQVSILNLGGGEYTILVNSRVDY
ncbi:hypothetical protein OIU76_005731 [Salix suchowensis]|nr:hypothetical protein OIU76_005731 [Salix suchowensis]KAJ6344057.1 hypothetical protein OIU76_005731 [Salix suchowensis]